MSSIQGSSLYYYTFLVTFYNSTVNIPVKNMLFPYKSLDMPNTIMPNNFLAQSRYTKRHYVELLLTLALQQIQRRTFSCQTINNLFHNVGRQKKTLYRSTNWRALTLHITILTSRRICEHVIRTSKKLCLECTTLLLPERKKSVRFMLFSWMPNTWPPTCCTIQHFWAEASQADTRHSCSEIYGIDKKPRFWRRLWCLPSGFWWKSSSICVSHSAP